MAYFDQRLSRAIVRRADCDALAFEPVSLWRRYANARRELEEEEMIEAGEREAVAV